MSENDPYGSEGGALNERPYPYTLSPLRGCWLRVRPNRMVSYASCLFPAAIGMEIDCCF